MFHVFMPYLLVWSLSFPRYCFPLTTKYVLHDHMMVGTRLQVRSTLKGLFTMAENLQTFIWEGLWFYSPKHYIWKGTFEFWMWLYSSVWEHLVLSKAKTSSWKCKTEQYLTQKIPLILFLTRCVSIQMRKKSMFKADL